MKKLLYLLLTAVVAVGCLTAFAGCGEKETPQKIVNDAPEGYVTLKKFDSWREMQHCHYSVNFGSVKINTDPQYITDGSGSAKITAEGDIDDGVMPQIAIDTEDDYFLTQDFTGYDGLLFDVFNASEGASSVRVWLGVTDAYGTAYTYAADFALAPGAWTKVNYDFSDGALSAAFDLSQVVKVYVAFPEYRTDVFEAAKVYYIDGMIARLRDGGAPTVEVPREENEILYFESFTDLSLLRYSSGMTADLETRRTYVTQGVSALRMTGSGRVSCKPAGVSGSYGGISVDVMHADAAARTVSVIVTYFDEEKQEYATVSSSASVRGNMPTTVTLDASRIEGVCGWSDIEMIAVSSSASETWLDNWRFTAV